MACLTLFFLNEFKAGKLTVLCKISSCPFKIYHTLKSKFNSPDWDY